TRSERRVVFDRDQPLAAHEDLTLPGEIERHHGNVLALDVVPNVELGPVGEGKDPHGLAVLDAAVEEVPHFGALCAGIPLSEAVAEGVDALFGAGSLFLATGAAHGCVDPVEGEGIEEGLRLQLSAAVGCAQPEWIGRRLNG